MTLPVLRNNGFSLCVRQVLDALLGHKMELDPDTLILSIARALTRQTILAIENGKYNPSLELAFKMAKYFETTIEKIFSVKES